MSQGTVRPTRIALLTPYTGSNLGDAAIQDAMIANLRVRLPDAEFAGITLNDDNFLARHGVRAFPLLDIQSDFYQTQQGRVEDWESLRERSETGVPKKSFRDAIEAVPALGPAVKSIYRFGRRCWLEARHAVSGYRFALTQDLIAVSGGGQLDEEWGGPWHHPYALFKWAVLARLTKTPFAVVSVGACKVSSPVSRFFLSRALMGAGLRSYRDVSSRQIASSLLADAAGDPVVPDLAFSLPAADRPRAGSMVPEVGGRTAVALSPIAYMKPGLWPTADRTLYERYVREMAALVSTLMERECRVVIVQSSLGDDESTIPEILGLLGERAKRRAQNQLYMPKITSWKELLAQLEAVDVLVASRLHSVILGLVAKKPTIAISFDPKVDWVMRDVDLSDTLLQIRSFSSLDVLEAMSRLTKQKGQFVEKVIAFEKKADRDFARQYDALAQLAKRKAQKVVLQAS